MTVEESIAGLDAQASQFAACIAYLAEELYLAPMDVWAPRDVLAHLVGWNRYTLEGAKLLIKGELPAYLVDAGDGFAAVNAALVRAYPARDRQTLLDELGASLDELRAYLRSLSAAEWQMGVRYGKHEVTVQNSVQALAADYTGHRQQIERWAGGCCRATP